MALTVYAEGNGFFHKGSGGKGVTPGDVCLSPPPPPTGPMPVPYVNALSASDLSKGSKTVKINGEPTALEDQSEISTSTGNEGGTQGGNVVTHKTKGKGGFKTWSFIVKVEGKGVCCHSDVVGQNCASGPVGIVDPSAITEFLTGLPPEYLGKPCPPGKQRAPKTKTTRGQRKSVRGGPCWSCGIETNKGVYKSGKKFDKKDRFVADHQPPQSSAWAMGGCHDEDKFNEWKKSKEAVKPQCTNCSNSQGNIMKGEQGRSTLEYLALGWP